MFDRNRRVTALVGILVGILYSGTALAADCNSNGIEDDCDISCGTTGGICDVSSCGLLADCNTDGVPDACEIAAGTNPDCNGNGSLDPCDIAAGTSFDCDTNGSPDECDVADVDNCRFPVSLAGNTTGQADSIFIGPPDDIFVGIGGQIVTYEFDCGTVFDGLGPDITVYEVDGGGVEFSSIDVLVSEDGIDFASVKFTESAAVNIPGDEAHGSSSFARSYDLAGVALLQVRFVRIDGNGTGSAGGSSGFDLDAIGAVHLSATGECNKNGVPDSCDLAGGTSDDCNGNAVPDECEFSDCNNNDVYDECDIAAATSTDCNSNGVPDECEIKDCNSNGLLDGCDIAGGTSDDCNSNSIPDECDLAPGNLLFAPPPTIPSGSGFPASYTIVSPIRAAGDVTITVTVYGDYSASNEFLSVRLNGAFLGDLFVTDDGDCVELTQQIILDADTFNEVVGDQDAVIDLIPSSAVAANFCPEISWMELTVEYEKIVDCNSNGQIDRCDIAGGTSADINFSGQPDECDDDCNDNMVPDDVDIDIGTSVDCNKNETPDECDIAAGTSEDCNADDRPDECALCPSVEVVFVMDTSSSMTDEAAALCNSITQVASQLQADLINVQVDLLAITGNPGGNFSCLTDNVISLLGDAVPGSPPINNEILGSCPGGSQVAIEDWGRATSVVAGLKNWQADSARLVVPISDEGPWCGDPVTNPGVDADSITHAITIAQANDVIVSPITGTGSSGSMIALAQQLAAETGGMQFSSSLPAEDLALAIEQIITEACATVSDCNGNVLPDECEVLAGTSTDCDSNGTPDECDPDCNTNGVPDACDIAGGTSFDCDGNDNPDACDPDCNNNGAPDACDLVGGSSVDCNGNAVPDECDVAGATSNDCNSNSVPDACDISGNTSEDCNGNLRPDECDLAPMPFVAESGLQGPFGGTSPQSLTISAALPASGDVILTLTVLGDFENANEFVNVEINGQNVGTVFETGGVRCVEAAQQLVVPADAFNEAVAASDAVIDMLPTSTVDTHDCGGITYVDLRVAYDPSEDCNVNALLDPCEIAAGSTPDVNNNNVPDECDSDCNSNGIPDKFEVVQGTSPDCNLNFIPDECDLAAGTSIDCSTDGIPDECQPDCNANDVFDGCDITGGTSADCNINAIPDECDFFVGLSPCRFPTVLSGNTTGHADSIFLGPPDDVYVGIGGQIVTYELDCGRVINGTGPDITVYEVDTGGAEFSLIDVLVSQDGVDYVSIKSTETSAVNIPGDETHGSNSFVRSYDLSVSLLPSVRFVRIDGNGTGSAGGSTGFDLDAIGAIFVSADCNGNEVPDECDISSGTSADCNTNGVPDECNDIPGGDCNCDESVNLDDHAIFVGCHAGPDVGPLVDSCPCMDQDHDGDVDLKDFALFQKGFLAP